MRERKGIKLITDIINAIITTETYNKNVNLKRSQTKEENGRQKNNEQKASRVINWLEKWCPLKWYSHEPLANSVAINLTTSSQHQLPCNRGFAMFRRVSLLMLLLLAREGCKSTRRMALGSRRTRRIAAPDKPALTTPLLNRQSPNVPSVYNGVPPRQTWRFSYSNDF